MEKSKENAEASRAAARRAADKGAAPEHAPAAAATRARQVVDAGGGSSPQASPSDFGALIENLAGADSVKAQVMRGLQRRYGNRYVGQVVRSGRDVSRPGDESEREADRLAERALGGGAQADGGAHADDGARPPAVGAFGAGAKGKASDAPTVVQDALRSTGQPLDASTRGEMEGRFGEDFGAVRVHADAGAAQSARELGASAYTVGEDVVFGEGRYAPHTGPGRELLAHELAHVAQQHRGGSGAATPPVQRQAAGAGVAPGQDIGTPPPEPTTEEKRERLLGRSYFTDTERFNFSYDPAGGQGAATVSILVYVDFLPFTPAMMLDEPYKKYYETHQPPEQKDCEWDEGQKVKFTEDLISSVAAGWGRKHTLFCDEPGLSDVSASLDVEVVPFDNPEAAHVRVQAQKTPPATPRYSSHHKKDEPVAVLDWRDPSEPGVTEGATVHLATARIGPFEPGKLNMTPLLKQQVEALLGSPGLARHELIKEIKLTGWAHTKGNKEKEDLNLANNRAEAVGEKIKDTLGENIFIRYAVAGRQNAEQTPDYQRVIVEVLARDDKAEQMVAAHEFGHLFAGLGDEYADPHREQGLPGDKPTHYDRVKEQLGPEAADDLLVANNASIMSGGNVVKPGHYVAFVEVLESLTGLQWKVR